jgi:phosphatidylglycerol---prolipoprotein diacylglyceryl transferase
MMNMIDYFKKNRKSFYLYGGMLLFFFLVVFLAVVPQDGTPYETIAVDLGFAQVAWYAVFILTGITLGAVLAYYEFKNLGLDTDFLFDALLWAVPLAIVGARIYYVIFDPTPDYNSFMDIVNVQRGGLSIHGAVITTIIFLVIFTRLRKVDFWLVTDIVAPGFLIGQIVGRWGNFMNAEAYGPPIKSDFIMNVLPAFIRDQMFIVRENAYHHPTFLYEGLWNFVGLVFLLIARRKRWFKVGDMIGLYLIWYGLGRGAIIEPLRTQGAEGDALRVFGQPVNIYLSLTLFMLGGLAIILAKRKLIKDQQYYCDMLVSEQGEEHAG